jgi:hypothetical protein
MQEIFNKKQANLAEDHIGICHLQLDVQPTGMPRALDKTRYCGQKTFQVGGASNSEGFYCSIATKIQTPWTDNFEEGHH